METQSIIGFLMAGTIIVSSLIIGMIIVASGQLMLAVREIALNTRQKTQRGYYRALEILSNLITVGGYIVMIIGTGFGIISAFTAFRAM